MVVQVAFGVLGRAVASNSTLEHLQALDTAIQNALDGNKQREESTDGKGDHMKNEQKNQGLINTSVNHNNQIKNVDNKINFVINNFANSSHIKEIHEKTKELERHIVRASQSHKSWREFLLLVVVLVLFVGVFIRVLKKYCLPRIFKYLRMKAGV
jgi:hypothetical protein